MASTCRGRAADSAAIAAGSACGSPPRTAITRAPATRAVVIAASIAVSWSPGCTSSTRRPRGGGVFVAGSMAGSVTTWMPGSAAASTFLATPPREHGARVQRLDPRPQNGAHRGPARPRRGQQQRRVGPQGRPGGRRQLSGPVRTGDNHHRRRDEQFLREVPRDHIGCAGQYRRLRRRQAGPCCQTGMRLLAGPGSTSAGRGGSNRCQHHEHRCGRAQHPGAALAGRPAQRAISAQHACGPSAASVPPPHSGELSPPQARHRQPSIVAITPRTPGFSRSAPACLIAGAGSPRRSRRPGGDPRRDRAVAGSLGLLRANHAPGRDPACASWPADRAYSAGNPAGQRSDHAQRLRLVRARCARSAMRVGRSVRGCRQRRAG
jgi:hypothetical protein